MVCHLGYAFRAEGDGYFTSDERPPSSLVAGWFETAGVLKISVTSLWEP